MTTWTTTPFSQLLVDTKDGEWGEDEQSGGLREALIVRGTDFANLDEPDVEFPRRWVKEHIVERKRLQPDDIILETAGGTSSQSTGRTALLKLSFFLQHADLPVLCASFSRHLRLKTNEYSPPFVYYLLQMLHRTGYMAVFNIQHTGVSRFQYTAFKNHTELQIPEFTIQRKIAAILSTYDELIENNKRRIAFLDKLADEVYREWFVRLRFPGHQKANFIKGVPGDWPVKKLGELVRTQYGYTASAEAEGDGPKFLRITDIVPAAINWELVPHCKIDGNDEEKYLLREGDIVVARTGATFGYAKRINKRHPKTIFASYLVRLIPKRPVDAIFLGLSIERSTFKEFVRMFDTGAAQPQANATTMALFPVLYPPEPLLTEFNKIVEPILDEKELLLDQIATLSRTRDSLLPRLISGKLSVENLDIQFPPGMAQELRVEPLALAHA
jgi:type I restriction enzyme, S subunit